MNPFKDYIPTTMEMECAIANHFGIQKNIIVPNISWGMGLHECDVLILSKAGYLTEVEIKRSRADLKKDEKKKHSHKSNKIKQLYFAIPRKLENCLDLIPPHSGVLIIEKFNDTKMLVFTVREPEINYKAKKMEEKDEQTMLRLGCLRIWNLKKRLNSLIVNSLK